MGVADYGQPDDLRDGATSLAAWAEAVSAALDDDDTTVDTRVAAEAALRVAGDAAAQAAAEATAAAALTAHAADTTSVHGIADTSALVTTADVGTAAALDVGTTAGTVAAGDDARFTDARTPTAHEHVAADIDSGAATDGQVLTADGAGGAAWESVPGETLAATIVDAKGDLVTATAADAPARLAAGSNGQVLSAQSGESTGLKWVEPASLVAINTQTDAYTLVLTDAGKLVTVNKGSAVDLTVPTNTVAFPLGTRVIVAQLGDGQVTIVGPGVTLRADPGLKIAAKYGAAELVKIGTDEWLVVGRLSA